MGVCHELAYMHLKVFHLLYEELLSHSNEGCHICFILQAKAKLTNHIYLYFGKLSLDDKKEWVLKRGKEQWRLSTFSYHD